MQNHFHNPKTRVYAYRLRAEKLLGACLINVSPSLDCIGNKRTEKLQKVLLAHLYWLILIN